MLFELRKNRRQQEYRIIESLGGDVWRIRFEATGAEKLCELRSNRFNPGDDPTIPGFVGNAFSHWPYRMTPAVKRLLGWWGHWVRQTYQPSAPYYQPERPLTDRWLRFEVCAHDVMACDGWERYCADPKGWTLEVVPGSPRIDLEFLRWTRAGEVVQRNLAAAHQARKVG